MITLAYHYFKLTESRWQTYSTEEIGIFVCSFTSGIHQFLQSQTQSLTYCAKFSSKKFLFRNIFALRSVENSNGYFLWVECGLIVECGICEVLDFWVMAFSY